MRTNGNDAYESSSKQYREIHRRSTARIAAATACMAALIAPIAACGSTSATTTKDGKPIVTVMWVKGSSQKSVKDMTWTPQLEQACDCSITWQEVEDAAWGTQKNAILASGDLADLSIAAFSAQDAATNNAAFEDLSDDVDAMPNVKGYLNSDKYALKQSANRDGKMYVIKGNRGQGYRAPGQYWFINKTWLDKLGLDMPTTWSEFKTVLEAFKTQDPNGNGKADEIPFSLRAMGTSGFWANGPMLMLNSTGIPTQLNSIGSAGLYMDDGTVKAYITDPRFKQTVQYLHELMADGLIPKDSLTKDNSKYQAEIKGEDGGKTALVGSTFAWHSGSFGPDLDPQYVAMPTLKADDAMGDDEVTWDMSLDQNMYTNGVAMSSDVPNKEAALKVINALYDERISVEQLYGTIPEYVSEDGDHTYTIDQSKVFADKTVTVPTTSIGDRIAGWIRPDVTINGDREIDHLQTALKPYADIYSRLDPERDAMPIYVTQSNEERTTLANNTTTTMDYVVPTTAKWIVQGGVENEWEDYLGKLKATGLDETMRIWQSIYDEQVK